MTTDTSHRRHGSAGRGRFRWWAAAHVWAASALLGLAGVTSPATASTDAVGLVDNNPVLPGFPGTVNSVWSDINITSATTGGTPSTRFGIVGWGPSTELHFTDDNNIAYEAFGLALQSSASFSLFGVKSLSVILAGSAIDAAGAKAALDANPIKALYQSGGTETVSGPTWSFPVDSFGAPFPNAVRLDMTFGNGLENAFYIGLGAGNNSGKVDPYVWQNLTYSTLNGGDIYMFIGADGALDTDAVRNALQTITRPVPIPPAVWLLGSGVFALVGLRRRTRRS